MNPPVLCNVSLNNLYICVSVTTKPIYLSLHSHITYSCRGERTTVRVGANLNICNQNNPHPSTQIIIMIVKWCRYTEQIVLWIWYRTDFYGLLVQQLSRYLGDIWRWSFALKSFRHGNGSITWLSSYCDHNIDHASLWEHRLSRRRKHVYGPGWL